MTPDSAAGPLNREASATRNRLPKVRRGPVPSTSADIEVAIVGGGACGMTAALALARACVESIVFERDRSPSGSTALSSGLRLTTATSYSKT